MGPTGTASGSGFPAPPDGFTISANPTLAQSPSGDVAHLDPLTNSWSIDTPPTDFVPDPTGTTPLTYVNPTTGQQLIYTGYDTWIDPIDHRPPIFYFDPLSGRTAWFNPSTGQWVAPTPPPGYSADMSQPRSRQGYVYTDGQGHSIVYSTATGGWFDWDAWKPLDVGTVERPGTGDATGRVAVPDASQIPAPSQDSATDALAKNSQYTSNILAVSHGATGLVRFNAPAYQADVRDLQEARALRDQMVKDGASSTELAIIDGHIARQEKYVALWDDHLDKEGHLERGGSEAVNAAAQMDDFEPYASGTVGLVIDGVGLAIGATQDAVFEGLPTPPPPRVRPGSPASSASAEAEAATALEEEHEAVMKRIDERNARLEPQVKRMSQLNQEMRDLNARRQRLPMRPEYDADRAAIDAELDPLRRERARLRVDVDDLQAQDMADTQRAVELSRQMNPPATPPPGPGPAGRGMTKSELDAALDEGPHLRPTTPQAGDTTENTQPMQLPGPGSHGTQTLPLTDPSSSGGGTSSGPGPTSSGGASAGPVVFRTSDGGGNGIMDRLLSGVVTPIGASLVIGLGVLGAFGGANALGSPAHVIQVPIFGSAAPATLPPGPLTISPISATLSSDGQTTTYQVMVTNVLGFAATSWVMNAPAGAPDCNHMTFGQTGMAVWHHGAADGCGAFAGSSSGIPGSLRFSISDGSGFKCIATYSGSLSGTGSAPSCQGGGPTQNPNAGGGLTGGTSPTSTLVSQTVPGSVSVGGGVLGGALGIGLGLLFVGTLLPRRQRPLPDRVREPVPAPIGGERAQVADVPADSGGAAAAPPKPIMPAAGKKRKRSCQLELDAMNRADRALQRARAAANAANEALSVAKDAVATADSAKSAADGTLSAVQNPTPGVAPPRTQEGSFKLRQIVRQTDNQGNPLAPTADDVKDLDAGFSHLMTIDEAQRADDQATADLAQAQANLAAAQAAANAADAAVDAAVKAYEDAREAYGKCLQEQREGT